VHCAVSWNRARLCVFAIGCSYPGDVRCDCRWNEFAVPGFKRSTRLATISAKAGAVDGPCETIHGLSAIGHVAVSSLCARCSARLGRSDLGKLLSSRD
jgi:hypothetical protein